MLGPTLYRQGEEAQTVLETVASVSYQDDRTPLIATLRRTSGLVLPFLLINTSGKKKKKANRSVFISSHLWKLSINHCAKSPPNTEEGFLCFLPVTLGNLNKIFFRENEQIFIFKYLNLYLFKPCLAQKELFIEDLSHLGMEDCVWTGFIYGYNGKKKKSITENGQIDCPTLNNNNHKNPSGPASSMEKFESLNRLLVWYKERCVTSV